MNRGGKQNPQARQRLANEALQYLDQLYRVALYLARDPHDAQDLVQEAYVRALDAFEQFRPGTNLKAWLSRILYNHFLDSRQRGKRWIKLDGGGAEGEEGADFFTALPAPGPGPEDQMLNKELAQKIDDALGKIPEEFRGPIVLVDMGELSYAEAAEVLSCPVGTVRSRLSRGRKYLHQQLKDYIGMGTTEKGKFPSWSAKRPTN